MKSMGKLFPFHFERKHRFKKTDQKHFNSIFLILILTGLTIFLLTNPVSALNWDTEVVDNSQNSVGLESSLALDSLGKPHITYSDFTNGDLKYAEKNGDVWKIEVVDRSGRYSSFAIDNNDIPHIAYFSDKGSDLKYAIKNGDIWTIESVETYGITGQNPSLALDNNNNPHISYRDGSNTDLKYIYKTNGQWISEIVDGIGDTGHHPSLALDKSGSPRIAYQDLTNKSLNFAEKNHGIWTTEVVYSDTNLSLDPSLALDRNDNPRISFYNGDVMYAEKNQGNWVIFRDNRYTMGGSRSSLALDSEDNPRICYYEPGAGLKYLERVGDEWTLDTIDRGSETGGMHGMMVDGSLVLDRNNNPHVSYFDWENGNLKYAEALNYSDIRKDRNKPFVSLTPVINVTTIVSISVTSSVSSPKSIDVPLSDATADSKKSSVSIPAIQQPDINQKYQNPISAFPIQQLAKQQLADLARQLNVPAVPQNIMVWTNLIADIADLTGIQRIFDPFGILSNTGGAIDTVNDINDAIQHPSEITFFEVAKDLMKTDPLLNLIINPSEKLEKIFLDMNDVVNSL